MGTFKVGYWFFSLLLSGVIAAKLTIPLLASWFGVHITITGATAVVGMYMYVLASIVVGLSLLAALVVCGGVVAGVGYGGYLGHKMYTRKKADKIKADLLKK